VTRLQAYNKKHTHMIKMGISRVLVLGCSIAKNPLIINSSPSPHTEGPDHTFATCLSQIHLPRDVIRSVARSRLCAHTLHVEMVTWTRGSSRACALCNTYDVQDGQHVLFSCIHFHVVSLCKTRASLFPSRGSHDVCSSELTTTTIIISILSFMILPYFIIKMSRLAIVFPASRRLLPVA